MRYYGARFYRGVTLIELILVLVMIAIGASLAVPKLRKSVEDREAKAALQTLKSISHATRMYEVSKGQLPANLTVLETTPIDPTKGTRYLDPTEYAFSPPYVYQMQPSFIGAPFIWARKSSPGQLRTISLRQCGNANKSKDGAVFDSAGFLTSPAAC